MNRSATPSSTARRWHSARNGSSARLVAPAHGTFPELLGDAAGLLHAPNDPADLARVLRIVLDDPARAAALGAAGHARVRARHTFATMAAGHEAVYASVLGA